MSSAAAADVIAEARLYRYALPLLRPLPVRGRSDSIRRGLLVRITGRSGAEGWGDIAPLPGFSRESTERAEFEARGLCRRLPGAPITPPQVLDGGWAAADGLAPSVRFGAESACLETLAAASRASVAQVLGGSFPASVRLNALASLDAGAAELDRLLGEGYRTVKVKVGRGPVRVERAQLDPMLRRMAGRAQIRLDANRAWSLPEAVAFAETLRWTDVEYIEEPLRDPDGLEAYVRAVGAPLAVDETLAEQGEGIMHLPGLRAVVLKPTLLGGVGWCLATARRATEVGILPVFSAAFESGVGIRMLAALAVAGAPPDTACGLDPYRWLAEDILLRPLRIEGGRLWFDDPGRPPAGVNMDLVQDVTDGDDTVSAEGMR